MRFTLTMWDVKIYLRMGWAEIGYSFTLTMWDVKFTESPVFASSSQFYLNYVGCKGKSSSSSEWSIYRFTLTMWDVKENVARIKFFNLAWFYLNYVGCKESQ